MTMTVDPRELVLITRADQMLAEARDIDTIREIRDKAQAAKAYAKKVGLSKDIILHAAAIKVQAERRLGQVLINTPLVNSAPGNQFRDHSQRSWIELDRNGHSAKPEEVREIVELVSPPPYLELYGHSAPTRHDWTVYGNQILPTTKNRRSSEDNV